MDLYIDRVLASWNIQAIIFDLDGTLVDNNEYHLKSWRQYLQNIDRKVSEDEYRKYINGRTNKDAVEYIYGRKMDDKEAMKYTLEKEAIYRDMYRPYIRPVDGLLQLLQLLERRHLPMGIATSGIQVNIDFMFEHVPIRNYFKTVINSTHIRKGKPDPEIYIKTAEELGVATANCLVFEDAVVGIKSAQAAGMKVIGVTTTHTREELSRADLLISDYNHLLKVVE